MRSIFVTGTDTEVGKTRISVGIIHKLVAQGYKVAAMKPVASGCEVTVDGLRNEDALALMAASNVDLPYELVNPYAFKPAIAPHIAAQQVGIDIDFEIIQKNYDLIQQQADLVVVEGAGGWLVPLNNTTTMADLAKQLKLDVVLVVGIRLGCINHALLTATAIQQSGLEFKGWVANDLESSLQLNEMLATLKQHIQEPNMGMVPQLSPLDVSTDYIFVV
jgi:dethiobiotin synthetase